MDANKFTKEVKDAWLEALKSGKYTQAKGRLIVKVGDETTCVGHCCIGVLGDIHPHLSNEDSILPYKYLERTIGKKISDRIWKTNDETYKKEKPDYSNVIPLIEALEVQS